MYSPLGRKENSWHLRPPLLASWRVLAVILEVREGVTRVNFMCCLDYAFPHMARISPMCGSRSGRRCGCIVGCRRESWQSLGTSTAPDSLLTIGPPRISLSLFNAEKSWASKRTRSEGQEHGAPWLNSFSLTFTHQKKPGERGARG